MPSIYSFLAHKPFQSDSFFEDKPLRLFVDSGVMGPGPIYSTMDAARQLLGEKHIPKHLFVVDYEREKNPLFNSPAATHLKNYVARYHQDAYEFAVAGYYECLASIQEPGIWLTGFSYLSPDYIDTYYGRYPIPAGTVIMVCNGIFGTPSFYSVKLDDGSWHHQVIQKTLAPTLPAYHASSSPIRKLILNNPYNWHHPASPYTLLLSILRQIPLATLQQVLIVCATDLQKEQLKRFELSYHSFVPSLKEKLQILGPKDIRLKESLDKETLVISEGIGVLADCLQDCALGIQILNPNREKMVSIYEHLLPLVEDSKNISLLQQLDNPATNFTAVIQHCLSREYRNIFFRYREKLIAAPGENILEALKESYRDFIKTKIEVPPLSCAKAP